MKCDDFFDGIQAVPGAEMVCHLSDPADATHRFLIKMRRGRDTKLIDLLAIGDGLAVVLPAVRAVFGLDWEYVSSELTWEAAF